MTLKRSRVMWWLDDGVDKIWSYMEVGRRLVKRYRVIWRLNDDMETIRSDMEAG